MSASPLDAAFMREQLRLEEETIPARREFDALVKIVQGSETPAELGFGVSAGHDELVLARDQYLISATVSKEGIEVRVKIPDASNYVQSMLSIYGTASDSTTAVAAAENIGTFMARIVEGRLMNTLGLGGIER
ncbi:MULTISPECIES: hypothetical protein [unclassified Caulobacter]|uniref:hypothetical protein n=1 Tax=unclassified Caulobacter TaxID=2648921 RepID=UPI000D38D876|nr:MULTISPECIES: hypothetical protein [unclassified Caulobacter]PTS89173.1 hypothetical protein DBR21_07155 [Caulobacter sp. HMWF009]PTT10008.1 hypothetical protein DBR10_06340 [Caulobacter sp. HMWF025]PTT79639.1 hypothetical protein DBR41_21250 [Pseudomonas sp. HMWF010]